MFPGNGIQSSPVPHTEEQAKIIPISMITFDIFDTKNGDQILARELTEPDINIESTNENNVYEELLMFAKQVNTVKEIPSRPII